MPLPPPPASLGRRPLPPDPVGKSDDAAPPLPARPGTKSIRNPPPPPVINGQRGDSPVQAEYLEPDDWTGPELPPRNFSPESSDSEADEYIEPETTDPPPPSISSIKPKLPAPPIEQETYDELDIITPTEEPQEVYDQCDLIPGESQAVYEMDGEVNPVAEELYEAVTDDVPPPPKPPTSIPPSRQPAPPPTPPEAPRLPARPQDIPTTTASESDDRQNEPDNNFLQAEISNMQKALKRTPSHISYKPKPPENKPKVPSNTSGLTIQQRIALMNGQSVAGLEVTGGHGGHSDIKPEPKTFHNPPPTMPFKPKVPPKKPPSQTPLKPQPASQLSAPDAMKRYPGYDMVAIGKEAKVVTSNPTPTLSSVIKSPGFEKKVTTPAEVITPAYEEEDIYDEAMSQEIEPIKKEEWYHGKIEREPSKQKLESIGQDGTFLVRDSTQHGANQPTAQPYTLVVLFSGHIYNLKVRQRADGKVALGNEKEDELAFEDVPTLISHHKNNDVILVNVKENKQYKTKLKRHPVAIRH